MDEKEWAENHAAHGEFEKQLQDVQTRQRADRIHLDELDQATREQQTALLKHVLTELQRIRTELEHNTRETSELRELYERGLFGIKVLKWLGAIVAAVITAVVWAIEHYQNLTK